MPEHIDDLARMRIPFSPLQISKLPKGIRKGEPPRSCRECGGYHAPCTVHLDYVGHAALTDRLLDVDPFWSWKPLALTPEGLPHLDTAGGLWIELTVCGVTRLGYGSADGKTGGDAIKELIGDALRNAAMRFGAALDLWHKGELHEDGWLPASMAIVEPPAPPTAPAADAIAAKRNQVAGWIFAHFAQEQVETATILGDRLMTATTMDDIKAIYEEAKSHARS